MVWNVDDEQAGILLATLNRLNGRDSLDKKLALLRRLHTRLPSRTLARLLPQTYGQIERLLARHPPAQVRHPRSGTFAIPLVFFVNEGQLQTIEEALAATRPAPEASTRATKRAAALTHLARSFLDQQHAEKAACPETESEVPVGT